MSGPESCGYKLGDNSLTTYCGCQGHTGHFIVNLDFDLSIQETFNFFFLSQHHIEFMKTQGTVDRQSPLFTRIENHTDRGEIQRFVLDQEYPMKGDRRICDSTASLKHLWKTQLKSRERQEILEAHDGVIVVGCTENFDASWGDYLQVERYYCLTRNGAYDKTRMSVHCLPRMKKSGVTMTMAKSLIENLSVGTTTSFMTKFKENYEENLKEILKQEINNKSNVKLGHRYYELTELAKQQQEEQCRSIKL